jgi:hypothetical protein
VARIKPGTMGGMAPGWTQTTTQRFRRGPRKRERRRVNPQEILSWLQLSQAVAQDKGIIGSVASRIQKSMRESELAEKRRQARMDINAETRKRREEIAETVDPNVQAEMAMMTPEQAQEIASNYAAVRKGLAAARAGESMPLSEQAAPQPAPAAAPAEAAAAPQAAEASPYQPPPAAQQEWRAVTPSSKPGPIALPPRTDIGALPQFVEDTGPAEPVTRPAGEWPPKVFTFTELMSQARGARTDEEFDRVAAQLPEVIKVDPAMGGGSLAEIISGVSRRDHSGLRMNLMNSYVSGQKEQRGKDAALAYKRRTDAEIAKRKLLWYEAEKEARIARLNAQSRTGSKDWNTISEFDQGNIVHFGRYISNPDDARLPAWLKGQPKATAKAEMTARSRSKGKGLNTYLRALQNIELSGAEDKMSPENRAQLAGIRTQMNDTRRAILDMQIKGGTLDKVVDWKHLKKQRTLMIQTLTKQQATYRKAARRGGMAADDIANMATGFIEELGNIPSDPDPMPKKKKAQNRPQE